MSPNIQLRTCILDQFSPSGSIYDVYFLCKPITVVLRGQFGAISYFGSIAQSLPVKINRRIDLLSAKSTLYLVHQHECIFLSFHCRVQSILVQFFGRCRLRSWRMMPSVAYLSTLVRELQHTWSMMNAKQVSHRCFDYWSNSNNHMQPKICRFNIRPRSR